MLSQDLLAIGKDHQYKLMDQADFLSHKQYGTTFLCKDCDVVGKDLASICVGAYFLQNLTSIQVQCNFDLVSWKLIYMPESYTPTLWVPQISKWFQSSQRQFNSSDNVYTQSLLNQKQIQWTMNLKQNTTNGSGTQTFFP